MKSNRPLESSFQKKVVRKLKTLPNTWFYKASDRVRVGVPDIVICTNGNFVALELKRDEKAKPTPLQQHILEKIEHANGIAKVVYPENWDEIWENLVNLAGALG